MNEGHVVPISSTRVDRPLERAPAQRLAQTDRYGRRFHLREHSTDHSSIGLSRRTAAEKRWPFCEIGSSPRPHQSDFAFFADASKNPVPFRVSFVRLVVFAKNFGEVCPHRGSPYALQSGTTRCPAAVSQRFGGLRQAWIRGASLFITPSAWRVVARLGDRHLSGVVEGCWSLADLLVVQID